MPPSVLIVGGGVIGCAAAYYLSAAGCRVTLFERGTIAAESTAAAAGMLAPLAEASEPGPFLELATAGLRAFQEDVQAIEAISGLGIEYAQSGIVRTAATTGHAVRLQRSLTWAAAQGLPARWLEGADLQLLEPQLGPALIGALYSPEEGHVRPVRLAQALAQAAARRGAELCEGVEVRGLLEDGPHPGVRLGGGTVSRAEVVLICGGAWSSFCASPAALPAFPVRGQHLLLRSVPQPVRRVIYGEDCYLVPRHDGTLYVGATEEPDAGFHKAVTVAGVRSLLEAATALVPALDAAELAGTGVGLRPGSPDGSPLLGWLRRDSRVAVATGHFRNGVLLSLISGRLLTELIVHGRVSLDLAPFAPDRAFAAPAAEVAEQFRATASVEA